MPGRVGRVLLWGVLLALLGVAWRAQHEFQFAADRAPWGWGMLAALAALCAAWLAATRGAAPAVEPIGRRAEWALALALCGLGIAFRGVHFDSLPVGMNHDAAFNGMYAQHILQGAPYTPYVSAAWGRETLFMYLCAALLPWFGNVPEPIQLAATLVGIATLPIFYLFARAVAGQRLALIGLALLAVSGWHGVFSRVGWRMILVPPFAMLALLGLRKGLDGRRWGWLLAGAGAAGAIYTYDAGRMVPLMTALLFLLAAVPERARWRERAVGGLLMLATFAVVGAPMLHYAATHPEQFTGRAAHLAESGGAAGHLLANLRAALAMFAWRGNGNDFFIEEPLLEPLLAVCFGLGLLVTVYRGRERGAGALLIGFALALLPGVLADPNGNRCILALPFVVLFAASGVAALADATRALLPAAAGRGAATALVVLAIAIAGFETYDQFLGPRRRPIIGFSAEATAAGQYLRRFDDQYARYVVAEDWPEYTLTYLSYTGDGTPLESHYVLGRQLDDIEPRINRYGRRGMVFATDLKPAGRAAFERLERQFAEYRSEPITAARLGGVTVGRALIVEPQHTVRSGLWSNASRALAVGGAAPAGALRCLAAVGQARGFTLRVQLMRPDLAAAPGGELALLDACPPRPGARPLLTLAFTARGLEARGRASAVLVPQAALEAGRWYEIVAELGSDAQALLFVDGKPHDPLPLERAAARLAGVRVAAPTGGRFFLDDLAALPGLLAPDAAGWRPARRSASLHAFEEEFEMTPIGLLLPGGAWFDITGPVLATSSPAPRAAAVEAAPGAGANAFDGGHGTAPGQFDQPIGVAVAPNGTVVVADRNNHRVQLFDRAGEFQRAWGRQGSAPGEFREPHDVAADDEFVYVADLWNQRVQIFDHDGHHVVTLTGSPSLSSPRGVAVSEGRIYVAEAGGGRVTEYDRDGHLQRTVGSLGSEPGQLREPVDVAVAPNGDLWVVNAGNNRLEHFAADGTGLGSVPISGWSGSGLKEVGLAIGADGTLYLSDWTLGAVRRFHPDGQELAPVGTAIRQPSGLAVDGARLLVAGRGDDAIRVIDRR